jgi:tRNA modification GTPase
VFARHPRPADTDTILAIASPGGVSMRGLIRISGPDAGALLRPHLSLRDGDKATSRRLSPARLHLDHLALPVLAITYHGCRTYTGEPALELLAPGNPTLLERIVEALLGSGRRRGLLARRAEPGEFTARAFLNGRLSLVQAEAVAATIEARSDAALRAARLLADGALNRLADGLAEETAGLLALVEAGIDFTDQEDVVAITPRDLHDRLAGLQGRLRRVLDRSIGLEQLQALPRVVLTGPPNAGKSTLFNALLGRDRAVVCPEPGTTRDVLVESLRLPTAHGAAEVLLVDLAGEDAAGDAMNRRMQAVARQERARADLLIRCVPPASSAVAPGPDELMLHTKSELGPPPRSSTALAVSARTGAGIPQLIDELGRRLADRAICLGADTLALHARHETALRSSLASLANATALVAADRQDATVADPELVASCLRAALDQLGAIVGDVTPDDVLGRIFSRFCIGK